jgi:hypothetical protein
MTASLTSRQLLLISHLIVAPSNDEACRRARVSRGALYAWLKDQNFQEELKVQKEAVVKSGFDRIQLGITMAANGLLELLNTDRPELKRLVCRDILDFSMKFQEINRIEARLEAIESAVLHRGSRG